jgi:hypothetical protein
MAGVVWVFTGAIIHQDWFDTVRCTISKHQSCAQAMLADFDWVVLATTYWWN